MNDNKLVIYFLTESVDSEKERNEIEYLSKIGRVVLVTAGAGSAKKNGIKQLQLKSLSPWLFKLCVVWSKLSYLLGGIAETSSDKRFTDRNVYTGNKVVRYFVNALWKVKVFPFINKLLPTYDSVYFAPIKVGHAIFGKKRRQGRYKRIVFHDSLVFRLNRFPQFVANARVNKIKTVANVKSWDNPFYSQFSTGADGYFVWSDSMWLDVKHVHKIKNKFVHVWGARPFYKFYEGLRKFREEGNQVVRISHGQELVIGYAAAFCDEVMGRYEISLIKAIAKKLKAELPAARILFRPYPVLPLTFYSDLLECDNITLVEIEGDSVRYDNGIVVTSLRIGSDTERFSYLQKCDCFLSMATSFTIEAAIFGLPIVHFCLPPEKWQTEDEIEFFKRIYISDHLLEYFCKDLLLANGYSELVEKMKELLPLKNEMVDMSNKLLNRMGIPNFPDHWPLPSKEISMKLYQMADVSSWKS
ncbi:MAG: hypothetical protein ACXVCP_07105 [Bdellovibrio sp.]